jgi:hypothetical protein
VVTARNVRFLLVVVTIVSGCSPSYIKKSKPVIDRLSHEDYDEALRAVETLSNDPFLYLVEKGTVLHYAEQYEQSIEAFLEAERVREELIVPSISEGAVSLVTSDATRSYPGEDYEDIFINYFNILNYLHLGEYDEALVEARKVDVKLRVLEDGYEGQLSHRHDAFIRYLTGVLYEVEGSYNDAFIAYEKSLDGYADYGELYGIGPPPWLSSDLVRTALWSGLYDEADQYREEFPELAGTTFSDSGRGEILVIFENGLLPHKEERVVETPVPHDDEVYFAKIAFPALEKQEPFLSGMEVRVDGLEAEGWMGEDLHAIAIQNLEDRRLREIARVAARAALKYMLTDQSRKLGEKLGEEEGDTASTERSKALGWLFGGIANLFGWATERADLRSWRSLPHNVYLARLAVPEGIREVDLLLLDRRGRVVETVSYSDVEVVEGEITFLRYRSY